ncbi:MAG TPA: nuclear transport factor 2 family protein [Pyrinomonadaceae bacterium]|nr:nuclear transport factor 2 family protein [Pyrinomonadaceae bacterium]
MSNRDIIKGLYNDFAKGNVPGVLGAMDANISWTEAEGFIYGGTYVGPNAILGDVFMKFATEWEGFSAVPHQIIDGGDDVVALGTYSGKYLKTGKSMTIPFAHSWTFADGKIVKFVQYTDTLVMAKSLGL